MFLVINKKMKKWFRRQTSHAFQEDIFHLRIYRNIFPVQYWEYSGNKKGKPEIFGLPIHIFFEYLDCFLLKGDFLRTTAASAQKRFQ